MLRQIGGAELVALAAAVVEARRRSIPVVLDGYGATAPAAALDRARLARSTTASPDTSRPSPDIAAFSPASA